MILLRVETVRFVAGAVAKGDRIVRTAPILKRWHGKTPQALAAWVMQQQGRITVVDRWRDR